MSQPLQVDSAIPDRGGCRQSGRPTRGRIESALAPRAGQSALKVEGLGRKARSSALQVPVIVITSCALA